MQNMDIVEEFLREAMTLYVNKLSDPPVPANDWPVCFKYIERNVLWLDKSVSCVIRKPDNIFYMIILGYENTIADISVNYVTEKGVFHSLALVPRDDSPFSMHAASALNEIKTTSSWEEIMKNIRTVANRR